VPNNIRQLALAVTEYHLLCHKALQLEPEIIVNLLKGIGALKSTAKFEDFILCCMADARGRTGFEQRDYPPADYLRAALSQVMAVSIADLVKSGIEGAEIGRQLNLRRIACIAELKKTYSAS